MSSTRKGAAHQPAAEQTTAKTSMTLEEASRIQQNYDSGVLDPQLPGTMELIYEARRVRLNAYMWGATTGRGNSLHRRKLLVACSSIAVLSISGLAFVFLASH